MLLYKNSDQFISKLLSKTKERNKKILDIYLD